MKINCLFLSLILAIFVISCTKTEETFILTDDDEKLEEAAIVLSKYLSETFPGKTFTVTKTPAKGKKYILLSIDPDVNKMNGEAYSVHGSGDTLHISGKTSRAVKNGVWGLLKEIGWNFYLSFEVPPKNPNPLNFNEINLQNSPLKEKRIIFNWHNFLSGCTGWDLEQWENWIDNSSKIGFNTIMVHAYGNNPMQSFSLNGAEKELGYLTTSQKGRDWGAQHVNDVRLMIGGDLFTDYEFGSEAAKVPENKRSIAATQLMQKVFHHAAQKSMDVCFAIDVDTWMANPQNIIKTLPEDALIEIGGYKTANPEHPEGKKYYEAQLKQLFTDYPEITMLAAWMRMPRENPGLGSIWLLHDSSTLPEKWREEYFEIVKKHPELEDKRPYPGIFAISKIVEVYRSILDEIKPEVELVLGSWRLDYPKQANPFMPEYCGFIPLDWEVIFDKPEVQNELAEVGKKRNLYPVVWAHHDDHRYIGRPYQPFSDFNVKLNKVHANGYGIIHWTTHPLDLYFSNTENQVWSKTENESYKNTIEKFVGSLLNSDDENLLKYYQRWFFNAPMFGRETTDYFIRPDEEYQLDGYNSSEEVIEKSKQRLTLLTSVNKGILNEQGQKEYEYQVGMEKFILSFFENHHNIFNATQHLQKGEVELAQSFAQQMHPEKTIEIYAETISKYGASRGEKGILLSLNLRWLPDYIDVKQQIGNEPIRINFQPTSHDPLAQGAGRHTFFIDNDKNFWLAKGEKETALKAYSNGNDPLVSVSDSWVKIDAPTVLEIKTMRGFNLTEKKCRLQLIPAEQQTAFDVEILEDAKLKETLHFSKTDDEMIHEFNSKGGDISFRIIPSDLPVHLAGIVIK